MEVLLCSGAHYVGESDCPEQGSETAFKYDGKSLHQDAEQVRADLKVDGLALNESHEDSEDVNLKKRDHFAGPGLALENSQLVLDTIESGLLSSNQERSFHSEIKALEQDEPQAV